MLKITMKINILLFLFTLILTGNAEAYLNPGAGSYIMQIVAALSVGAIFLCKAYWKKIKNWVSSHFSKKDQIR